MSIILGIILPIVLFILTLPLKATMLALKLQLSALEVSIKKTSLSEKLGLKDEADFIRKSTDTAIKATKIGVESIKGTVKLGAKSTKLLIKSIKLLIRTIKFLIFLLKSLAALITFLMSLSVVVIIAILLLLIVLVGNIVMVSNSGSLFTNLSNANSVVTSDSQLSTNNGAPSANAEEWLKKCEEMGKWFVSNINTYQGNTDGHYDGSRKGYKCDLVGVSVGDDCSGFISACLAYANFIDPSKASYSSAPASTSFLSGGDMVKVLENAGWTHYSTGGKGFEWKAGDIAAISGHVELVVSVDGDTMKHFGWGTIRKEYPCSTCKVSEFNHGRNKYYTDCFRLE